jgi:AcrR family transcriptional regulator
MDAPVTPRRTSGGPVLQQEVTDAIASAFFEQLAEVGYGRLSIEGVARRAGAGKAAVYRRWRSKTEMTIDLVSRVANAAIDVPDTGTLHGDIRQYLENGYAALRHPLASRIIPDLLGEASRNSELTAVLQKAVRDPRRIKAREILDRAVERGWLPADVDMKMCLDFLGGPLYWRVAVIQSPIEPDYFDRVTDKIIAACKA